MAVKTIWPIDHTFLGQLRSVSWRVTRSDEWARAPIGLLQSLVSRVVSQGDGHAPDGPPAQLAPRPKSHRGCLLKQARRCRWVLIPSST